MLVRGTRTVSHPGNSSAISTVVPVRTRTIRVGVAIRTTVLALPVSDAARGGSGSAQDRTIVVPIDANSWISCWIEGGIRCELTPVRVETGFPVIVKVASGRSTRPREPVVTLVRVLFDVVVHGETERGSGDVEAFAAVQYVHPSGGALGTALPTESF